MCVSAVLHAEGGHGSESCGARQAPRCPHQGGRGECVCASELTYFIFFCLVLLCPLQEIQVPIPWYGTAAARATLPTATSVCSIFVCPSNGMPALAAAVFRIFDMRADVDACDCAQWVYEQCESICTES